MKFALIALRAVGDHGRGLCGLCVLLTKMQQRRKGPALDRAFLFATIRLTRYWPKRLAKSSLDRGREQPAIFTHAQP